MTGVDEHRDEDRSEMAGQDLVPRPDDAVLIPIPEVGDDAFLVLADHWSADLIPMDRAVMLSESAGRDLTKHLGQGVALANVGLQGLNGLQSVQGLVRLAPETLRLMQAGAAPLTSGGANLGTLAQGGKIVAQVRWMPAAGASAVGIAAALGPAIALAAIQFQLQAMSRKLDLILEVSDEILRSIRVDYWTEVETSFVRLRQLWGHAEEMRSVSGHLMEEARGRYWTLSHRRAQFLEDVTARRRELDRQFKAADRNKWLAKNTGVLMRDLQCLVLAAAGCQMYDLMWAQHVSSDDPILAQRIIDTAHDTAMADRLVIGNTLTDLTRRLELMALAPGSERIYMFGLDEQPQRVVVAARQLSTSLTALGVPVEEPLSAEVEVKPLNSSVKETQAVPKALETIRLHLQPTENLEELWIGNRSYLCLTDHRAFACSMKSTHETDWGLYWVEFEEIRSIEDWGNYNIAVRSKSGSKYKFEIYEGPDEKETSLRQARELERQVLRRTGSPLWKGKLGPSTTEVVDVRA
jgi:hypothetical protein